MKEWVQFSILIYTILDIVCSQFFKINYLCLSYFWWNKNWDLYIISN